MVVLQLGPYPPPHGGVQTNLVAIHRYLQSLGIDSRVINLTRYRQADQDGVFYPRSGRAVFRLLLGLPHTIAHLHIGGNLAPRLLLLGLVCSWMPGRRSVLTFHSGGYPDSPEGRTAGRWTLRGFVFRRFDRIICVNRAMVAMFVGKFGVPARKVRLIPPHVLPEQVPDVRFPPAIEEFFARHQPVLLSMGWLEPEYDFPLQIKALGPVRQKLPQAGLMILGAGRLEAEIRRQIAASGLGEHVLLPGDMPHEMALAAIARAEIFLRTTWYDGDAISVRESLHLGTPVIASDNGMRPPGVRLIPMKDLPALVEAICAQAQAGKPEPPQPVADSRENIRAVYELYREISP